MAQISITPEQSYDVGAPSAAVAAGQNLAVRNRLAGRRGKPYSYAGWIDLPASKRKGFRNYKGYLNWWNQTVKPRLARGTAAGGPKGATTRINQVTGQVERTAGVDNSAVKQAELIAAGLLDPQLAAINRAIEASQRQEMARAEAFKGVSAALAQYTGNVPGAIQAAYQGAADRTAAYAGGMTGALREQTAAAAQQAGQTIAQIGAQGLPAVSSEGGALANVGYYLGGQLPAANLAAEAASRLAEVSTMRAAGGAALAEQALQSMRATREETEELRMRGLDLERTRPAEVQKALASLRSESREERQIALQERAFQVQVGELQLARAKSAWDRAEALTNLTGYVHTVRNGRPVRTRQVATGSKSFVEAQQQQQQNVRTAATIAAANRRAAATNARIAAENRIDNALAAAKFGLSKKQYDLAVQREGRLAQGGKKGGFTPLQMQKFRGATNRAINAAVAFNRNEENKNKAKKMPVDILRAALSEGVPFSVALQVMQNAARQRFQGSPNWQATLGWGK